jgi:Xaa-Pro aminopeptidase
LADTFAVRHALPPEDPIDVVALRRYRLRRVRDEMAQRSIDACILLDPVSIRYACGARNMQVFHLRNPARSLVVPVEGPVVLFEFTGCMHLAEGLETVDEIRPSVTASYVAAGDGIADAERAWAHQVGGEIRRHCGPAPTVGVERVNAGAAAALAESGLRLVDAQAPLERARSVKSLDEIACIRRSLAATAVGMEALRDGLVPGRTENEVWSLFHQAVVALGGEYVETRLLSSGPRTNPWFQEAGERVIEAGDLVAVDTDVVGCYGYYSDFSRTFHVSGVSPTPKQRELYRIAREQVEHNMGLLRPGLSFRDYARAAWRIPDRFAANRYYLSAHGCGMTGEYPYLYHEADFDAFGYDGALAKNMTICVESYIGEPAGGQGVKLEQQVLLTADGPELLSTFPFEEALTS